MNRPLVGGAAPVSSNFPDDLLQPSEEESAAYSEQTTAVAGKKPTSGWPSLFRGGGGGGGDSGGSSGGGGGGGDHDVELGVAPSTGYQRASDDHDGVHMRGGGGGGGAARGGGMDAMGVDHGSPWPMEPNLDLFYNQLYTFWKAKGWASTVAKGAADVATLGFTILLSTFMLAMVKWSELTTECRDEKTCGTFEQHIDTRWLDSPARTPFGFVVFLYFVLFSLYWGFTLLVFAFYTVPTANRMHRFFEDVLRISKRELTTVHWAAVVGRLGEAKREGRFLVASADACSPLNVALRVMRKENFLVAMFNEERLLDIKVPGFRTLFMSPLTQNLLYACVLNEMFSDGSFALRSSFRDAARLRRRFVRYGLLTLALMPFLLLFMVLQFFLKNAHDWKSGQAGPRASRDYSPAARWRFREYNELDHVLDLRLGRSVKHAEIYQKLFPDPTLAITARTIVFVAGALLGLLAVVSVLNEDRLLFMSLGGRQLFFYGTVLGAVFAGARAFVPITQEYVIDPEVTMKRIASHTHYFPRRGNRSATAGIVWQGQCHTYAVKEDFNRLYQHKIMLFLGEVVSVIWTPWLLLVTLPAKAEALVEFVLENKTTTSHMGDMCKFATFDFDKVGGSVAAGHVAGQGGGGGGSGDGGPISRTQRDKMQKSCLNFAEAHPDWHAGRGAAEFVGGAARYAAQQNEARARAQADLLATSLSSSSAMFGQSAVLQPGSAGHMALFGSSMDGGVGGGVGGGGSGSDGGGAGGALLGKSGGSTSIVVGAALGPASEPAQPEPVLGADAQEQHPQPPAQPLEVSFGSSVLGASALIGASLAQLGGGSGGGGGGGGVNPLLLQTITESAHENNFYWLEERLAAEEARQGLAPPAPAAASHGRQVVPQAAHAAPPGGGNAGDGYMEAVGLEANTKTNTNTSRTIV